LLSLLNENKLIFYFIEKYLKTTVFGMTGHAPDYAMLMVRKKETNLFFIYSYVSDLGRCQCWCDWYDQRTSGKIINSLKTLKRRFYF
jgi:hypothetical protein